MSDTEFSATRMVGGDELILRRLPGSHWEVDRYDCGFSAGNPFLGGSCPHPGRMAEYHFRGQSFASPDEAADAVRRFVTS